MQNTIHPQVSLHACIHIQMASVHSEMERSEISITFEKHRNIWTRTSRSISTGDPLAYTVVSHHPSCTSLVSFTAIFTVSAAAVAHSQACTDQVLAQQDLAQTLYSVPSPVRQVGTWDQSVRCISQDANGEKSLTAVHLGPQMGKWGPPWPCFSWGCDSESHTKDMQSPGKSVSLICWFAKNNYFPLLLKISKDYRLLKKTN